MKVRFERIAKDRLQLRPQTRQHPPEYLSRLADSLLRGQLQPIGLLHDFAVIWGNGRVLAARLKPEITHLWAAILDEEISEQEFARMRAVENFARNELTTAEKCKICDEYVRSNPSLTLKTVAADLGVDPAMVTKWGGWGKVIEPVRQALAAGKITLNGMYTISQLAEGEQEAALVEMLAAPNAEAGLKAIRRKKNGSVGDAVRLSRGKFPLSSGVEITVVGKELALSDLIEALSDLLKQAKRGSDQGWDIRTLVAVVKDAARKE